MNHRLLSVTVLLLSLGSCRTLPPVSSFVDASSQMRKGVAAGFNALNQSLLSDDLSSTTTSGLTGDEKELKALARTMDRALLGITAYAGALGSLVESGNAGEKNAAQVANGLTQLVNQFAPQTATTVVRFTAEEASKLYGQIAKVKAANSLKVIMDEATPTVDTLGTKLSAMVNQLVKYNRSVYQSKRNMLTGPNTLANNSLDYERYLKQEQVKIFEKLALISKYKSDVVPTQAETFTALKTIDPIFVREEKDIEPRQAALVGQSLRIDSELQRIKPVTDAVKIEQQHLIDEYNLIDQLFKKANDALATWTKANADIRKQLDKKQRPNFQELLSTVEDLEELRQKLNALKP